MSGRVNQLENLKARRDLCVAQDDQKLTLITDLLEHVDELSEKIKELEEDLQEKRDVIKVRSQKVMDIEKQMRSLQHEKVQLSFVSMFVDGDGFKFRDELVKQGIEGGRKAASLLKQAVEAENLASDTPAQDFKIIIRVYASVKGLKQVYQDTSILSDTASFDDFIHGFNMGGVSCDFVDAGPNKECADKKIEAMFKQSLLDVHCRRIFLAVRTDSGYFHLLSPNIYVESARGRIVLIEGPLIARDIAAIKDKFTIVKFDDVFRSQKLEKINRNVSFSHITPPNTPTVKYATVPSAAGSQTPKTLTLQQVSGSTRQVVIGRVHYNRQKQRVDLPLSYSSVIANHLKVRKLCNAFHILGRCPYAEATRRCTFDHTAKLNPEQLQALRVVARQSAYRTGLRCDDTDCISGHRCTKTDCYRPTCFFPTDMHDVDTSIVT